MFGFIGKIISGIAVKIIVLVAMVAGGKYFVAQNGGIQGVAALVTGGDAPAGTSMSPTTAGIGGIMTSLGLGGSSAPKDYFEQQGRISQISVECRLSTIQNGKMLRTPPMPCSRANEALRHQQYSSYELNKVRTATYIYYGQDGVSTLTGATDAKRGQKVGDIIDLRVNKINPRISTAL